MSSCLLVHSPYREPRDLPLLEKNNSFVTRSPGYINTSLGRSKKCFRWLILLGVSVHPKHLFKQRNHSNKAKWSNKRLLCGFVRDVVLCAMWFCVSSLLSFNRNRYYVLGVLYVSRHLSIIGNQHRVNNNNNNKNNNTNSIIELNFCCRVPTGRRRLKRSHLGKAYRKR